MTVETTRRRFTADEYHSMSEAGILTEDDRVELLDGEIVQMSPIGRRHAACVKHFNRILSQQVGEWAIVSVQDPVALGGQSEPQPDVALLRWRDDFYASALPTAEDVILVVEVGETSVDMDRQVKARLYAAAGIPELWRVDLAGDTVEVHREPRNDAYATTRRCGPGEVLAPAGLEGVEVAVDRVLVPGQ